LARRSRIGPGHPAFARGADAARGARAVDACGRRRHQGGRVAALWHRHAPAAGSAPTRQGRAIRAPRDHRARGQGRQGPGDRAAREPDRAAARAPRASPRAVSQEYGGRPPGCLVARCAGGQIPQGRLVMGLAAGVSQPDAVGRSAQRYRSALPLARVLGSTRGGRCSAPRGYRQALLASRASPPTCCRPATTHAPCRSCSATAMCGRR
jgi:hypothetical protein